jgi:hypothetical protein
MVGIGRTCSFQFLSIGKEFPETGKAPIDKLPEITTSMGGNFFQLKLEKITRSAALPIGRIWKSSVSWKKLDELEGITSEL